MLLIILRTRTAIQELCIAAQSVRTVPNKFPDVMVIDISAHPTRLNYAWLSYSAPPALNLAPRSAARKIVHKPQHMVPDSL